MLDSSTDSAFETPRQMMHALARNWGWLLLRGICAILFGVITFVWPGMTLVGLMLAYGVYALGDGICAIAAAIAGGTPTPRWWLAIVGLLGVGVGVVTFAWPGMTALALLYCLALWTIAIGILQIVGAIQLRKVIDNEWFLIISGIVSILFGLMLLARPGAGTIALILALGAYAIVHGILLVWFALRLHKHVHPITPAQVSHP